MSDEVASSWFSKSNNDFSYGWRCGVIRGIQCLWNIQGIIVTTHGLPWRQSSEWYFYWQFPKFWHIQTFQPTKEMLWPMTLDQVTRFTEFTPPPSTQFTVIWSTHRTQNCPHSTQILNYINQIYTFHGILPPFCVYIVHTFVLILNPPLDTEICPSMLLNFGPEPPPPWGAYSHRGHFIQDAFTKLVNLHASRLSSKTLIQMRPLAIAGAIWIFCIIMRR